MTTHQLIQISLKSSPPSFMFLFFSIVAIVIVVGLVLLVLFEPGLEYHIKTPVHPIDSEDFLCLLSALADAQLHRDSRVQVLTNGQAFYKAQLDAIHSATKSINLEAYIFLKDDIGHQFIQALADRAKAGVKVNLVIDAVGSFSTWNSTFEPLRQAGGQVRWYQPFRLQTFKRFNNRTHRELLIVDGQTGFIGGAGIGDNWITSTKKEPAWRDTVVKVTGDLVIGLQTTFTENWLEAADEILVGDEYFSNCLQSATDDPGTTTDGIPPEEEVVGMVVISTPSAGRSTRSRILFQTLLASAKHTIHINSPYFLPDPSVQRELIAAVQRGVSVKVIVPGEHSDHLLTRRASRRRFGHLLEHGVEIYEYAPAMIHVKALVIDNLWAVIGSTNFDHRSFGLNDEVNLAARNTPLAHRLTQDFENDLTHSHQVTLEEWRNRPLTEKITETLSRIIERQQ